MDDPTNPEILLISSVIQTGDLESVADAGITGEYFHSHRFEWEWIESFATHYRKIPDKATFRSQFPDFPLLRTTDVEHAVATVENAHLRYELARTLRDATTKLAEDDPTEAMSLIHSSLTAINHVNGTRETYADAIRDYSPILAEAQRRVDASQSLGYAGVTLGFHTLNNRTGGLHPGDLAIWAARLGQGKTWMLCKVATEALLTGKRVCFVSLEQPRTQIIFRIYTLLARELGYRLRHRDLMQGTNVDLDHFRTFLVDLPTRITDGAGLFVSDPRRGRVNPFTLATLMDRHGPDLLIIDYLTLMQQEGDDWRGARKLSAETKLVASQYGVPILAAAQINRLGEGGRRPPSADKLAESDSIGQDADLIVTMKRESQSVLQLLLAKNRSGQDGQVFWSSFRPDEGVINEIAHDEALTLIANDVDDEE